MEVVTDNRNRSTSDLRNILSKNGGNLGERGCVSWMFDKKGLIVIDKDKADEDELIMMTLDAGAEDIKSEDDSYEIITEPQHFESVRNAVQEAGIETTLEEISMIPQTTVKLDGKEALQLLKIIGSLEDHDDVQNVWANLDFDESQVPSD